MSPDYQHIWQRLDETCRKHNFSGWDPFDGLNSTLLQRTPLYNSRWVRLAWLQAFKRLPINLRPLLCVPRRQNAKAMALFARSYFLAGDNASANYCIERLLEMRCDVAQWGGAAWGYPFDWQAKAFFVPRTMPNVICTAYAVLALEAAEEAGLLDAGEFVVAAAELVIQHLQKNGAAGTYIAYVPNSAAFVHNASLWGAWLCAKAFAATGQEKYKNIAQEAVASTLAAQEAQGRWRYGTLPHHQFVDGFHTGYNLEALFRINRIMGDNNIADAIERGLGYYVDNFFSAEGCPHYYDNNRYPVDPHSAAQAIITFTMIAPGKYDDLRTQVADYICATMWDDKRGYFYYQETPYYMNKNNYLRWTQAWMHLALWYMLKG